MKNYGTFEDLEVYKAARDFRKQIYSVIKELPDEEKYNLASHMRRAATSLTNNIAEGNGRYHCQESIQFCGQARGSLAELMDDLNICIDEKYISDLQLKEHEINKLLNGVCHTSNAAKPRTPDRLIFFPGFSQLLNYQLPVTPSGT